MFDRSRVSIERLPPAVRYKWSDQLLAEGFLAFPKPLFRTLGRIFRGGLGMEHLAVLLAVIDYRRPNPSRQPSLAFLAFNAGLPPETTMRRLAELRDADLVKIDGDADGLTIEVTGFLKLIERASQELEESMP